MKNSRSMIISIIGRPNVGKSSIFNRLLEKQNKALTFDRPGVTRDRHYGIMKLDELQGVEKSEAILVDTGGFFPQKIEENIAVEKSFYNEMRAHAKLAIDESDLILMVVDVREGFISFDKAILDYIRNAKKEFLILINKFDSEKQLGEEAEFFRLGIHEEEMFLLSAAHGRGFNELKQILQKRIEKFQSQESYFDAVQTGVVPREEVVAKLALIGAPNVGKSTLLNQLIGKERALVSDIAGTTVDPIEGYFDLFFGPSASQLKKDVKLYRDNKSLAASYEAFKKEIQDLEDGLVEEFFDFKIDYFKEFEAFIHGSEESLTDTSFWRSVQIVDTAGIRKNKLIDGPIEAKSVYRSIKVIEECDIVLYLMDARKGVTHQDRRLIDLALDRGKSLILCLNKFDLLKDVINTPKKREDWLEDIRYKIPWLEFCDTIAISAKTGLSLKKLKETIRKTIFIRQAPIPTGKLNRVLQDMFEKNSIILKRSRGVRFKMRYSTMVKCDPPTILLYTNKTMNIPANYKKYLQNGLRKEFSLRNTPIHLIFRSSKELSQQR